MVIDAPAADEFKLIYDAWANSFRKSQWAGCVPNHLWDSVSRETARTIIERGAQVLVAVTPVEGQDDTVRRVMGFVVAEPHRSTLHFLYVKEMFRSCGVGTALLDAACKEFNPELDRRYTHRMRASTRFLGPKWQWDPVAARIK